jgi:hypothetical protein
MREYRTMTVGTRIRLADWLQYTRTGLGETESVTAAPS